MAEGGYDPDDTFPGGDGDVDEKSKLDPHHRDEEMGMGPMKWKTKPPWQGTSTSRDMSFMGEGTPSGKIYTSIKEQEKAEISKRINISKC